MSIDIEDDIDTSLTNIGKAYLFYDPYRKDDEFMNFSSRLKDIGQYFDRSLRNKTKVLVISDPVAAIHPTQGNINVVRILAGSKTMWVLSVQLTPL